MKLEKDKSVVILQQIIDSNKEGTSEYYKEIQDGYDKLKLGVGIDALVDLVLLKLEEDIVEKLDQLAKQENVEQLDQRLATKIDSLMTELSKIITIYGIDPNPRQTITGYQNIIFSGYFGSDASNNIEVQKYNTTIMNELENVLDGLFSRYEDIIGVGKVTKTTKPILNANKGLSYTVYKGTVSSITPPAQVPLETVDSQETTPMAQVLNTSIETQNIAQKQIRPVFNDQVESSGPQVVSSAKELKKSGIKVPDTVPIESAPDKADKIPANSGQSIEMPSMSSTKKCDVYTPQESDDKNFKKMMKESCNKNENCTFDDESEKCNTKGGTTSSETTSSETTSEIDQSSSNTSSDAANAIPQDENIPAATGSVGAQSKRCDDKTWSQVLQNAKVKEQNVVALCYAGIEKGEITTSDGTKIDTDIPKNKGYKKIEINGDGNCGWYSMLEYFHLYGNKLGIDSSSELGKIIDLVKGSTDVAGRGPSGEKEGLSFSKEVVTQLRNYAHSLSGKSDNQLTDKDIAKLGEKMNGNTICLYESGAQIPKWVYYSIHNLEPSIIVPDSVGADHPIPMMLYHTGGSGTDSSKSAEGHYSLLTLGEGDTGKVFNDFKDHTAYNEYVTNSSSVSPSTETTQASSAPEDLATTSIETTSSKCKSEGYCNEKEEWTDYYKTLKIKRPSKWSDEYAAAVDILYKKNNKNMPKKILFLVGTTAKLMQAIPSRGGLHVHAKHMKFFQIKKIGKNMIQHMRNAVEKKKRNGNLKKYQNNRLLVLQPQMQFHKVKIFLHQPDNKLRHQVKIKKSNREIPKLVLLLHYLNRDNNYNKKKKDSNHKQLPHQNLKVELFQPLMLM